MPNVILPAALRRHMPQPASEVEVTADSVGDALQQLVARHPELKASIFDSDNQLRAVMRVFVGEEPIDALDGLATTLGPRDEVILQPPIAGG